MNKLIGLLLGLMVAWTPLASVNAVEIATPGVKFTISPENGQYEMADVAGGVTWQSNPYKARFGDVVVNVDGKQQRLDLGQCQVKSAGQTLEATFNPIPEKKDAWVRVKVTAQDKALDFTYEASPGLNVESIRLLDDAMPVTSDQKGYMAVPVREGLVIPADSGLAFTHGFDTYTYEGCHMTMLGVVKNDAAAMITWEDPYVLAEVKSVLPKEGKQTLSLSMVMRKSAKACTVRLLGKGDYVSIAKAYREIAKAKGLVVTWDQKLQGHPERTKYLGAINYKLWSVLDRRMNEDSTKEERVQMNWTFDEVGQVAEHLKNDLKLEKVLFIIGGWIHRGYDNQHPDVLPAAPECGGNEKMAEASKRVMGCGYLFCLHDNYQDMYKDAPSWDESYLLKHPDGKSVRGGHWAGGFAYLTCAQKAVELAKRPQNLPAVKKLTNADSYFIDTTYAAGLLECFDPKHPLTRADDMHWKQAISDYAREMFGSFGSECGREWAIPHADFFEGMTGVSGTYYHDANLLKKLGATVVPLFEIVYRDCIAMYGKYGYDINKSAEYVLHHISIGRPLNYHSIPAHLYWKQPVQGTGPDTAGPGLFVCGDNGWTAGLHPMDRFVKNTYEILSPLNEITSRTTMTEHRFLTEDRKVRLSAFGEGPGKVVVVVNGSSQEYRLNAKLGGQMTLPANGFVIESPTFVAFCATQWNGIKFTSPTLFTLRSLDGKPIAESSQVRIFHGFGDAKIKTAATEHTVQKEAVLSWR
ncbi:MAG: DUF5696 domain-containing protein [Bacillota bacterium]